MKYMTAGELRGTSLVAIVDDVPAGLRLQAASIQADLDRWSHGCSCGERREVDCAAILSGVSADGRTTGSPLSLVVDNAAYRASLEDEAPGQAAVPRPGSADLAVFWRPMPMIADPSSRALRHVRRLRLSPHRRWRVNFWPNSALKSNLMSRALALLPCASSQSISRPCAIPPSKSNLLPFVAHRRKLLELWRKKSLRRAWRATRLAARSPWRYTALLPLGVVSRRRHDGPPVEGGVFRE